MAHLKTLRPVIAMPWASVACTGVPITDHRGRPQCLLLGRLHICAGICHPESQEGGHWPANDQAHCNGEATRPARLSFPHLQKFLACSEERGLSGLTQAGPVRANRRFVVSLPNNVNRAMWQQRAPFLSNLGAFSNLEVHLCN